MKKKLLALALALTLAFGGTTAAFAANTSSVVSSEVGAVTAGETVTCYQDGTMAIKVKAVNSTIYSSYKIGGTVYKVQAISANSVGKRVSTLTINPGVTVFKKNAFAKAKNLSTIYIKCDVGTKASAYGIQKKAFKSSYTEDTTIVVSNNMKTKQFNKLKKKLRNGGFKGVIIQGAI